MRRASACTRSTFSSYKRRKACASPRAASTTSLVSRLWGRALWSRVKGGCQVRVADISPDWTGVMAPRLEAVGPPGRAANPVRGRATDQRGGHLAVQPGGRRNRLQVHDVCSSAPGPDPCAAWAPRVADPFEKDRWTMNLRSCLALAGALALLPALAAPASAARTYTL